MLHVTFSSTNLQTDRDDARQLPWRQSAHLHSGHTFSPVHNVCLLLSSVETLWVSLWVSVRGYFSFNPLLVVFRVRCRGKPNHSTVMMKTAWKYRIYLTSAVPYVIVINHQPREHVCVVITPMLQPPVHTNMYSTLENNHDVIYEASIGHCSAG